MENIVTKSVDTSDNLETIIVNNVQNKIIPKVKNNMLSIATPIMNNAIHQL